MPAFVKKPQIATMALSSARLPWPMPKIEIEIMPSTSTPLVSQMRFMRSASRPSIAPPVAPPTLAQNSTSAMMEGE